MPRSYPRETVYANKYKDKVYEYRIVTLSERDYMKLPRDYREYYDANCRERIRTEQEYL